MTTDTSFRRLVPRDPSSEAPALPAGRRLVYIDESIDATVENVAALVAAGAQVVCVMGVMGVRPAQQLTEMGYEWTAPELVALQPTSRRALLAEFVAATYDVAPEGSTSPWSPTAQELTSAYAAFLSAASRLDIALVRDAQEDIGAVPERTTRHRGGVMVQGRFVDHLLIRRGVAPVES